MKVNCCKYLGCRWYGLESDQTAHEAKCKYGNASGLDLINLLENTSFDNRLTSTKNYNEKIVNNLLPLFESEKLAAIDFEIKDVKNMLTHGQMAQMNTMSKCKLHDHSLSWWDVLNLMSHEQFVK